MDTDGEGGGRSMREGGRPDSEGHSLEPNHQLH
jgi:hypothetical protein